MELTKFQAPSECDNNVYAITYDPSKASRYTIAHAQSVFPNLSTVYAQSELAKATEEPYAERKLGKATAELISDRMMITHSNISDPDKRRTLLDQMDNGFLSHHAISNRPKIKRGSELSNRRAQRVVTVKMTIPESRHLAFTSSSPKNGPHALHEGDTGLVYNMAAFRRIIEKHAERHTQPIESLDFTFLNDDRLKCYQRVAELPWPEKFIGKTSVSIASPSNAPSLFGLIDDPVFPGYIRNAKNLSVDVSLSRPPDEDANVSWAYTSPDLESVTFRVQHRSRDRDLKGQGDWRGVGRVMATESSEGQEEGEVAVVDPTPSELAKPFPGSTSTRFVFTPAFGSEHLANLCEQATLTTKAVDENFGQVQLDM
jgi:hypothetical protein